MTINQSTGIVSAVNGFSGSGAGLTSSPNSATTATDANTANAIIARDDSKNFIANVMTGSSTTVLSQNGTNKITFNVLYHVGLDVYVDGTKFAQILFDTNYT